MIPPYCPICKVAHYEKEGHRPPFRTFDPPAVEQTTPETQPVQAPPVEVPPPLTPRRGRPKIYPDVKTRNREYMRRWREKHKR